MRAPDHDRKRTSLFAFLALMASMALPLTASAEPNACRALLSKQVEAEIARHPAPRPIAPPVPVQAQKEEKTWLRSLFDQQSKPAAEPSTASAPSGRAMAGVSQGASKGDSMNKDAAAPRDAFDEDTRRASSAPPKLGKAALADKKASGPLHYSRTNTQEDSVDEGDIVKTDGRTIYHVSCSRDREASECRNELRIFSSWPVRETKLLARYAIPTRDGIQAAAKQIFLHGSKLVLLMGGANANSETSRILVLDVSNPSAPQITRELSADGGFIDARMIGSRLYLATASPAMYLPGSLVQDIHTRLDALDAAGRPRPSAMELMAQLDSRWSNYLDEDPSLPRAHEHSPNGGGDLGSRPMYGCADVSLADTIGGAGLLNLVQFDIDGTSQVMGAAAAGHSGQSIVYASEGAFYVADPIVPRNGQPWQSATLLRKFELGRGGKPRFEASGTIRGTVLNQFAISEHAGHVRVATSDNWTSNDLYVLRSVDGRFDTVGLLSGLARNERIYAVRLLGDRGYIVTFRRTDPLFTLDLSNPANPVLAGELHVDGFSTYLHPLGKNHLLAVGQDTDSRGLATGFHLQVFDVTNPRQPLRRFHEKLAARSTSDAQGDHHAFMFEPETNTLSVPWKSENYWGLVAYRVDPAEGFVNLGRVNHALMYKQYFQKQCAKVHISDCGRPNLWWTFVTRPAIAVDRIIAIDNHLYSTSPSGLMVHRVGRQLQLATSILVSEPSWRPAGTSLAAIRQW